MSSAHQGVPRETADMDTASEDYARRFAGQVGEWFLEIQARSTLELLSHLPTNATIIDVGGGHAQVTPALIEAGYRVVVAGSNPSCGARLHPWLDGERCRFEVGNLQALPYHQGAFDAAVCFRLLPHSIDWTGLVRELCRVARQSVILDYPSTRSVNVISNRLFALKKQIEGNTRAFQLFQPHRIAAAFRDNGFRVAADRPQFLLPMVLHRWARRPLLSKAAELPGHWLGLTRWLGSPVIVRADRQALD